MAFSSCSPLNRIKVFHEHKHEKKKKKTTQAEVRIARPSQSRRVGSLGRHPHSYAFLALSHSLREKLSLLLVVSAAWLPSRQKGERSSSFYWVQKNVDIG